MLELRNISYQPATGDKKILEKINLKVYKNDIILICGKSGSGKTTLLEIISGLTKPQEGSIYFDNKIISTRKLRWTCGMVFQFPERYFIGTTVGKELKIGRRSLREIEISDLLMKVGLRGINMSTPPEKLSGGEQRRLAVAVQLLRNPNLILFDEPTAGLDWSMKNDVTNLINQLKNKNTVIVVTHEPQLFKNLSTKIFNLDNGRMNIDRGNRY